MSQEKFVGSSAVVVGGVGGIGRAVVERLVNKGAKVVIADRDQDGGEALAASLGPLAVFHQTDVGSDASVSSAMDRASEIGTFRFAVIAHGGSGMVAERIVGRDGSPADMENFEKTINVYLAGTYRALRLASARIATSAPAESGERGAVVMTASIAGYEGQIGQSAYAAAKAGVIGLTVAAARDLSANSIRVNTIAPGTIRTPMLESLGEEVLAKFSEAVPFPRRLGLPSEFAEAAEFLLTCGYVNGEVLRLDGGQRFQPR